MESIYQKELSDKYLNQILIPLRGVFDTAIKLRYIKDNPTVLIKNRKIQKELPDPFTTDEVYCLLDWLNKHTHGIYYLYYKLAFFTGLRPCELLALLWQDVYEDSIYIHRTRLDGKDKSSTKNKVSRYVLLNQQGKDTISMLKALTGSYTHVFIAPSTLVPFYSNEHLRKRFKWAIEATGIRNRPAYNTRHTYATMLLMSGVNPAFVANQLGHSLQMLLDRYARWINNEQDKIELSKLKV